MKKIKTFEDACKKLKINPKTLPVVKGLGESIAKAIIAYYKLCIIRDAIVGKFKADYSNGSQRKWQCWCIYDASLSAFRFADAYFDYTDANAGSGARLSFETEEQAIYFGEQFIDLHNDMLLK